MEGSYMKVAIKRNFKKITHERIIDGGEDCIISTS